MTREASARPLQTRSDLDSAVEIHNERNQKANTCQDSPASPGRGNSWKWNEGTWELQPQSEEYLRGVVFFGAKKDIGTSEGDRMLFRGRRRKDAQANKAQLHISPCLPFPHQHLHLNPFFSLPMCADISFFAESRTFGCSTSAVSGKKSQELDTVFLHFWSFWDGH